MARLYVTGLSDLVYLNCYENQLSALDLSTNIALEVLECGRNSIAVLDVSNSPELLELSCHNNELTSLDVTSLTEIRMLLCRGNLLTSLDLSNNTNLGSGVSADCHLDIGDMPTLTEVCVWTLPFPPEGFRNCREGSPNIIYTADCSK